MPFEVLTPEVLKAIGLFLPTRHKWVYIFEYRRKLPRSLTSISICQVWNSAIHMIPLYSFYLSVTREAQKKVTLKETELCTVLLERLYLRRPWD